MNEEQKIYPPVPKGSWRDFGGEKELRRLRGYSAETAVLGDEHQERRPKAKVIPITRARKSKR